MKFLSVAALAFATLAAAQSRDELPKCSLPCLDKAVAETSSCDKDDFSCICENFEAIQGAATGCILSDCGQDTAINEVLPATQKLCKEAKGSDKGGDKTTAAAKPTKKPSHSASVAPTPVQTEAPVQTGAAAGFGPVGGLAIVALGALAL